MISKEAGETKGRYSPGYGDLSLSFQPVLLNELNAAKLLGITLTDSYLMIPRKSISAIIGVKE
jgi:cobalamin-dependent methionine synthase I